MRYFYNEYICFITQIKLYPADLSTLYRIYLRSNQSIIILVLWTQIINTLLTSSMKNLILQEIKQLKQKQDQKHKHKIKSKPKAIVKQIKQETQLSKSSTHSTIFKSSTQTPLSKTNLFEGMSFCFPQIDIDLSPKRVEFMSRSIRQQAGIVFEFKDQPISEQIDYLLINPRVPIGAILRKVEKKIVFKQILDYNFVLDCMRESVVLAIAGYSLYRKNSSERKSIEERTFSLASKPQKMVKIQQSESLRCYKTIDNYKQEDQTQDEEQPQPKTSKAKAEQAISQHHQKAKQKKPLNKDAFLCQKGLANLSSEPFSINKFICDELMKLQKIYQSQKDVGRKIAYLKAVSAIRSLDKDIENQHDLDHLRGVGSKIIKKVKELLHTGKLEKLERLQHSEKRVVIQKFCKIWGVGPNKAEEIYSKGVRSIDELKAKTDLLTKNQKIGLKYYEDLLAKIPRQKITRIFSFVMKVFGKLVDSVDNYWIEVCGSYRRGRAFCGDIDIIISRKDHKYEKKLLIDLILELEKEGLLTDHLVLPSAGSDQSSMSYMGICKFQDQMRHRIDIKYYPTAQYAFAILYFTGSDMFNRSMRLYASKIGLQLSDHGAVARQKNPGDELWDKPIPSCSTEKDIFEMLGLDYKSPKQRDV